MQPPYRYVPPPQPPRRVSAAAVVLLLIGVLALCPTACCSTIATIVYRHKAASGAPAIAAAALAQKKAEPDFDDAFTLTATPRPSEAVKVTFDGTRGALVPIRETSQLALFVHTESHLLEGSTKIVGAGALPAAAPGTFVVHRQDGYFAADEIFGVPIRDLAIYALEDPRGAFVHEARVSGIVAIAGAVIGVLAVALSLLVRRATRSARPQQ